jgi:addiction module RelB/DinJ family antitoxin
MSNAIFLRFKSGWDADKIHKLIDNNIPVVYTRGTHNLNHTTMKTTMHIKVDKDIKDKSQKIAGRMGLSLSTIVNASLRNFIKTETFSVSTGEEMTPYMESWIVEIEKDKKTGKNVSGPFNSIEELKAHLSK